MHDPSGTAGFSLKHLAKSVIRSAGYELRRTAELPAHAPDIRHAEVSPNATYSPWLADEEFQKVYEGIRGNTLVDRYRCYELWQLIAETAKLESGDVLEVGVWRGGTGVLMAQKCRLGGLDNMIYLCDTFRGVVKAGAQDGAYAGGEHADTNKAIVLELCRKWSLDRVRILEGIFPDQTAHEISDRRFRLCHIDVDVYQSAKDIADWVWPRLVSGGMVVYDDYGFHDCTGITRFVNEERLKPDRLVIHNLNGHAVVIKLGDGATPE
ncbi:MAG TPA: TylF/MycF/NovP-related O-methyltransferase [Candidatus Acidoferrales bacterium]|nr:TylF/MycF/NovP-related O-methyltransferase [Candidatus Acidoferrales bacterium]